MAGSPPNASPFGNGEDSVRRQHDKNGCNGRGRRVKAEDRERNMRSFGKELKCVLNQKIKEGQYKR